MDWYFTFIGLLFLAALISYFVTLSKRAQLRSYTHVRPGMSEEEMLSIMGGGYNRSYLANNRVKYEWRMESVSYGRGGVRSYSGVRKVDIYTRNGRVEEVKPYNVK